MTRLAIYLFKERILDGMTIRKATIEDISVISLLWLEMVKELAPDYNPRRDWWEIMAKKMFSSGLYNLFVAGNEGFILGFIDFFTWPEPATGEIHAVGQHFYCLPAYRKTSIPGKLYKRAINSAKKQNCSYIELCCFENEKPMWIKKGFLPLRSIVRRPICLTQSLQR